MKCKVCGGDKIKIIYNGRIRDGGLGKYTEDAVTMWQCEACDVIWHDVLSDTKQYYESREYRNSLEGSSDAETFYDLHDREALDKFQYTGTDIYRHKVVADIGCGAGAFLDFLSGVCKTVIGIEPSETYRQIMSEKGYQTYAYAKEAKPDWKNKVDIVTSFDVIEHVENPMGFIKDVFDLLSGGGHAVIGTPTDAPVMRQFLGECYERTLLFSTQHLWIFSEKNMEMMARNCGCKNIKIKYFQRYGIDNMLGWIRDKKPNSEIDAEIITDTLNNVWKRQCNDNKLSDYIVLYLEK